MLCTATICVFSYYFNPAYDYDAQLSSIALRGIYYAVYTNVIRYMAYTMWYILSMHVSTYKNHQLQYWIYLQKLRQLIIVRIVSLVIIINSMRLYVLYNYNKYIIYVCIYMHCILDIISIRTQSPDSSNKRFTFSFIVFCCC